MLDDSGVEGAGVLDDGERGVCGIRLEIGGAVVGESGGGGACLCAGLGEVAVVGGVVCGWEGAAVDEGAMNGEGAAGEFEDVAGAAGHGSAGDDGDVVLEDVGGGVGDVVVAGVGTGVGDGGVGDLDGAEV